MTSKKFPLLRAPFTPISITETRDLLKQCHNRDHELVPGIILRNLLALTEAEVAEACWTHIALCYRLLCLPSRTGCLSIPVAARAWLQLYRPTTILRGQPISPLPPREWSRRFRRLVPYHPISHLRRSRLYYRQSERASFGGVAGHSGRLERIRLAPIMPSNYEPPITAPVIRIPIEQSAPIESHMVVTDLDLI